METSLAFYFLTGVIVCFIGTLPFGPVNLTVVKITVERNAKRGFEVAVIAALMEILHASIAIFFGMIISEFLQQSQVFRVSIALVFLLLGLIVWRKNPQPRLQGNEGDDRSALTTAVVVSLLNPQAIPFWIFALATINSYIVFYYEGLFLSWFLVGVALGKLLALTGFIILSQYLKSHLKQSARLVNKLLALVLILIGLSQLIRFLFT